MLVRWMFGAQLGTPVLASPKLPGVWGAICLSHFLGRIYWCYRALREWSVWCLSPDVWKKNPRLAVGLVEKMRAMVMSGLQQSSVDIVDLIWVPRAHRLLDELNSNATGRLRSLFVSVEHRARKTSGDFEIAQQGLWEAFLHATEVDVVRPLQAESLSKNKEKTETDWWLVLIPCFNFKIEDLEPHFPQHSNSMPNDIQAVKAIARR